MTRSRRCLSWILVLYCTSPLTLARADLVPILGGQAVYDTDLDITWLADGAASAGSIYDDGDFSNDGKMTWDSAMAWAASLETLGGSDWRLPVTVAPDPTCANPTPAVGHFCSGSELGHLSYIELSGVPNQAPWGSGDPDNAHFQNMAGNVEFGWSQTIQSATALPYAFDFNSNAQGAHAPGNQFTPLVVHDGNLAPSASVPTLRPLGLGALATALAALAWLVLSRVRSSSISA